MARAELTHVGSRLIAFVDTTIEKIDQHVYNAVVHAGLQIRDEARQAFHSNSLGYRTVSIHDFTDYAEAIQFTKVRRISKQSIRAYLSGLGPQKRSKKFYIVSRALLGGTVSRYTTGAGKVQRVVAQRGSIQGTDTIRQSLNEQLFIDALNRALNIQS